MTISIVERAALPVTFTEVKRHLRVDHTDDDILIAGYVDAVLDHLSTVYNRALGLATYLWTLDDDVCGTELAIPLPPLRSIVAVRYLNDAAVLTPYATSLYEAYRRKNYPQTYLRFTAPAAVGSIVNIEFTAGEDFLPFPIQSAVMLMTARLYEHRGEMIDGKLVEDRAAASLLSPYRPMVV